MIINLKNNGLIKPFLRYGVLSVLLAVGLFAGTFTASASDNVSCYDIVRQGMDVDFNGTGVFNSGKPIFDEVVVGAPQYPYQGCLEDMEDEGWPHEVMKADAPAFGNPPNGYYQVKGWAWNDNLGWISMYCEDEAGNGAPYENNGIDCGDFKYGVTIDEFGNFYGYAWGDNTGWISFNNGGFSRVKIEVDPPECQGYVYGSVNNPAPGICPAHTKNDTMAWSDNVGWMDFDGVIFPWFQVTEELTDPQVIVELIPDPNQKFKTAPVPADKPPVANGVDGYAVRVTILDQDGMPLEEPRYQTDINLKWTRDTVKKDQTTNVGSQLLGSISACTPHANRAVTKPCLFTTVDNYSGFGVWEGLITSVAPTSNMNKLLEYVPAVGPFTFPSEKIIFDYEKFIVPVGKTVVETNDLTLDSVDIDILDTANGLWVYGDVVSGTPVNRGFNLPEIRNVIMKFLPQSEVTILEEDDHIDYIDVNVNEPQSFSIDGYAGPGATVTLYGGLEPVVTGLKMVFDSNSDGEVLYDENATVNATGWLGWLFKFIAGVAQQAGAQVSQYIKGIYVYSIVSEPNGVYYYSNKLPRVVGSTGVQPVAILRGSVYSVGAVTTTTTQGEVIRSLGDISTNLLRDQVFRNVSGLIAGVVNPGTNPVMLVKGQGLNAGGFEAGMGTILQLLKDKGGVPKVYYSTGDIYVGRLGDSNPLTWTGERTIVTVGGNIYVDQDLYNAAGSPRPKLGLIALKDYSAAAGTHNMQGHVYIHNTVTNVQANIFADGSVFSYYDKSQGFHGDGRPVFADVNEYEDKTRYYQLFIEGSVASQNTIGGSTRMPRIDGLGKEVGSDVLRARQYDLNFLKMYTGLINRALDGTALDAITGDPILTEGDLKVITPTGLPWSKYLEYLGEKGDLWPPNDLNPGSYFPADGLDAQTDLGSTYIYYDPPSPTLPGFQGGTDFDISITAG